MKKLMTSLLLLLSVMPGIACAAEDCMMVEFPEHVELVCTGDGVRVPVSEQKTVPNNIAVATPATTDTKEAAIAEQSKPEAKRAAEPLKPEEMVMVPKSLEIRLKRAEQTMERMRQQQLQRNTDPAQMIIKPLP